MGGPGDFPEPPFEEWGDGPAAYEPGNARSAERPDAAPGHRRRADRPRLDAALEGRHRRRLRDARGLDFYRPAHEIIHDAIIDLYGRGEPADLVTVADELAARRARPHRWRPLPPHALLQRPDRGQRRLLRRDRPREVGPSPPGRGRHPIAPIGYAGEGQVDNIVDSAQAEVFKLTDKRSERGLLAARRHHGGVLDEIELISNREAGLYGVPTGFADLDDLTNGFHAGQMIIVAARPAWASQPLPWTSAAPPRSTTT